MNTHTFSVPDPTDTQMPFDEPPDTCSAKRVPIKLVVAVVAAATLLSVFAVGMLATTNFWYAVPTFGIDDLERGNDRAEDTRAYERYLADTPDLDDQDPKTVADASQADAGTQAVSEFGAAQPDAAQAALDAARSYASCADGEAGDFCSRYPAAEFGAGLVTPTDGDGWLISGQITYAADAPATAADPESDIGAAPTTAVMSVPVLLMVTADADGQTTVVEMDTAASVSANSPTAPEGFFD